MAAAGVGVLKASPGLRLKSHEEPHKLQLCGFLRDYPDLLNVGHMREITGLSAQTIRAECANGRIPAVRIGRRWFIPKALFAEYVGGAYER